MGKRERGQRAKHRCPSDGIKFDVRAQVKAIKQKALSEIKAVRSVSKKRGEGLSSADKAVIENIRSEAQNSVKEVLGEGRRKCMASGIESKTRAAVMKKRQSGD
ncbi:hypothetical protein [Vibrio mediterranei]|uniref:hypothetical protein n=1 Tax=Vibrio mediterranei TaxID=689 RepID=UPI0040690F10